MARYYPNVTSNLVALGINAQGSRAAQELASAINIVGSAAATRPAGVQTQKVRKIIARLLDDQQFPIRAKLAMAGEDRMILDFSTTLIGTGIRAFILAPRIDGDAAILLHWNQQTAKSYDAPNWAAAKREFPDMTLADDGQVYASWIHPLLKKAAIPPKNFVAVYFRVLMDRRATVIIPAMALWHADHPNSWPKSLQELTPNYLPAIPVDPYSPTSSVFMYKPDAPAGPIIYSVYEDGLDDGGSEMAADPHLTAREPDEWEMKDRVYHLIPAPPTSRPVEQ